MSTCRSCPAQIQWAETVPGGKRVPLDVAEVDATTRGALIVVGRHAYSHAELVERLSLKEAVSDKRAAELIAERYTAHLSHFATCPNAGRHRRCGTAL